MPPGVLVVGSINHDLTVRSPRIPVPGETILGTGHFTGAGGKGANQAIAVARLGGEADIIGRVGDDNAGRELLSRLEAAGVGVEAVTFDGGLPTGRALIILDDQGENAIVVSPGANGALDPDAVGSAAANSSQADVCLAQLEVPMEAVERAARDFPGLFVLNPAPAAALSEALRADLDVLIPNRSELASLADVDEPVEPAEVVEAIALLEVSSVVVTLGRAGAMAWEDGRYELIGAPLVEAVDTTGSGDAFCGAFALAMAGGADLFESTRFAVVAGAVAATRRGAAASMPTRDEVEALLEA